MLDKIVFLGLVPIVLIIAFLTGGFTAIKETFKMIKKEWDRK